MAQGICFSDIAKEVIWIGKPIRSPMAQTGSAISISRLFPFFLAGRYSRSLFSVLDHGFDQDLANVFLGLLRRWRWKSEKSWEYTCKNVTCSTIFSRMKNRRQALNGGRRRLKRKKAPICFTTKSGALTLVFQVRQKAK